MEVSGMRNLIRREDLDALKAAEKLHKSDDKIIGFIYESYEYDKFKKLLGNRDIDEGNKNKLRESMRIKQLPIPGVVNEGLEVIDAQTRLSVCEEDKMPFIYICAPGMNIDDCILANTNSKNWSVKNRLKTYADRGNENYKRFIDIMEDFNVSEQIVMLATGIYFNEKEERHKVFNGELIFTEEKEKLGRKAIEEAEKCYEVINAKGKAPKRQYMIRAFIACAREGMDLNRMLKACEKASLEFIDTTSQVEIYKQIIPFYNKGRHKSYMGITGKKSNVKPIFKLSEAPEIY